MSTYVVHIVEPLLKETGLFSIKLLKPKHITRKPWDNILKVTIFIIFS